MIAFNVNTADFKLHYIGIWNQTFRPGLEQWPPCLEIQRHATCTAVRDCLPLIFRLKRQKYSTVRSKPYFPRHSVLSLFFLQPNFHRGQLSRLYEKTEMCFRHSVLRSKWACCLFTCLCYLYVALILSDKYLLSLF